MQIAIFGKQFGTLFNDKCAAMFDYLERTGVTVFIYKPFYDFLTQTAQINIGTTNFFTSNGDLPKVDLLFSIGGDGTFLDAMTIVRNKNIPIVGINAGRLGFLADIAMTELPVALAEILEGKYITKKLDLLELETSVPCFGELNFALNELAIQKRDNSSMITIHTYLDNEFLNSYWADGLIIATPTGSTAYSLSVGGPIIHPSSSNFVITPIAPHNLTVRPLVVPNNSEITLKIEARGGKYLASLDSRSCILDESVTIKVKKGTFSVSVIERLGQSFYTTLRSKLMWGADKRN